MEIMESLPKKKAQKSEAELKSLPSSYRSYWSLKKVRMGYDEIGTSVSSEYNFIEKNGFGCLLSSINNIGIYYPREENLEPLHKCYHSISFNRVTDFYYEAARKREREEFYKKYNEQMRCLADGVVFKTKLPNVADKRSLVYPTFKKVVGKQIEEISEREMRIIKYEKRYNLYGWGTFKFREMKINQDRENRESIWMRQIQYKTGFRDIDTIKEEIKDAIKEELWPENSLNYLLVRIDDLLDERGG